MPNGPRWPTIAAVGGVLAAAVALGVVLLMDSGLVGGDEPQTAPQLPGPTVTVLAVGDIGVCDSRRDDGTARLAEQTSGTILGLGDIAYPDGTESDFRECFGSSWGNLKSRIRPAPGNHEYRTSDAAPYFSYFGSAAGDPDEGWYSFDLGDWHLIALNSNCEDVGGCDEGSPQEEWLRADLAANESRCTLAFWHAPRFSSGERHGSTREVDDLWRALAEADADVVLAGHEHLYERFEPLDADGDPDADGMRQFVVGTGGAELYEFDRPRRGSEVRIEDAYGLLKLTLAPASYSWEFLTVDEDDEGDSGTDQCR